MIHVISLKGLNKYKLREIFQKTKRWPQGGTGNLPWHCCLPHRKTPTRNARLWPPAVHIIRSIPSTNCTASVTAIEDGVAELRCWVISNMLMVDDSKMESFNVGSKQRLGRVNMPFIHVGGGSYTCAVRSRTGCDFYCNKHGCTNHENLPQRETKKVNGGWDHHCDVINDVSFSLYRMQKRQTWDTCLNFTVDNLSMLIS